MIPLLRRVTYETLRAGHPRVRRGEIPPTSAATQPPNTKLFMLWNKRWSQTDKQTFEVIIIIEVISVPFWVNEHTIPWGDEMMLIEYLMAVRSTQRSFTQCEQQQQQRMSGLWWGGGDDEASILTHYLMQPAAPFHIRSNVDNVGQGTIQEMI